MSHNLRSGNIVQAPTARGTGQQANAQSIEKADNAQKGMSASSSKLTAKEVKELSNEDRLAYFQNRADAMMADLQTMKASLETLESDPDVTQLELTVNGQLIVGNKRTLKGLITRTKVCYEHVMSP